MNDFTVVKNYINSSGDETAEFTDIDGQLIIKQYSGINSDNYIIKKINTNLSISFSIFKLNKEYYISINGDNVINYRKFKNIKHIFQLKDCVVIKNNFLDDVIIRNCDMDIVKRFLSIITGKMKSKGNFIKEFIFNIFY